MMTQKGDQSRADRMKVAYFHRKPRPNANFSIELVFENVRRDLAGQIEPAICIAPCESNGLFRRLWIAWHARRRQGDVNHVTGDTNFTALALDGGRTVLTNHDCGYVTRTRGFRRWLLKRYWLELPVRRVAAVTTVSSQVKHEIIKYSGCPADKIHVIHNAASPAFRPAPKADLDRRPRILHVGTAPNKNLDRLIDALQDLECVLVVVGQLNRDAVARLDQARIDYENYVDLSTSDLVRQYQLCDLVCFASLYEGFGVPILEAQAVGRPLITSNRLPMSEVAGEGACLVDPTHSGSIRAAIVRIFSDPQYRRGLVEAGRQNIKRFEPQRIALQYLELYQQVFASAQRRSAPQAPPLSSSIPATK